MQAICLRIWKKRHKRKKERRKKTQQCYGVLAKSVEPYLIFGYYYVINSQYGSKCLTTFFRCVHRKKKQSFGIEWCSSSSFFFFAFITVRSRFSKWRTHGNIMLISNSSEYVCNRWIYDADWMNYIFLAMVLTWDLLGKEVNSRFFFVAVCHRSVHTLTSIASIHFFVSLNIWQPQFFFAIQTACVVV